MGAFSIAVFIINRLPLCLATLLHISARLDRYLIMKVFYFFFCYAHIPAQLRQKLAPRANRWFLKGHASAQKGFRCFDPSSRSRRPGMLPSMSTSSSTPPYFSRRLLDQHLLDLLHQWFFLRLPCIRGSQSPKEIRVAALY